MEFEVRRTRREGKPVPRWQLGIVTPYRGHLIITEERDPDLNRLCRCAKLIVPDSHQQPQIEPLWDVTLIYSSYEWLVLAGFERIETLGGDQRHYAQSWVCSEVKRL